MPSPATTAPPPAPSTTLAPVASAPTTTLDLASIDTGDIVGFELDTIELDGETLVVAIADRSELRRRGLMGVSDFGEVDGMLFVYDLPTNGSFWMRDTLVPLDIAFFDADGGLIKVLTMVPCPAETPDAECARYSPGQPYIMALERPAGTLLDLAADAVLSR